jgi:hypothetical protein
MIKMRMEISRKRGSKEVLSDPSFDCLLFQIQSDLAKAINEIVDMSPILDPFGTLTPELNQLIVKLTTSSKTKSLEFSYFSRSSLTEDGSFCYVVRRCDALYLRDIVIINTQSYESWTEHLDSHDSFIIHENTIVRRGQDNTLRVFDFRSRETTVLNPDVGHFMSFDYNPMLKFLVLVTSTNLYVYTILSTEGSHVITLERTFRTPEGCKSVTLSNDGSITEHYSHKTLYKGQTYQPAFAPSQIQAIRTNALDA